MSRRFIVLGHTQRTTAPLPLNDPSGAGGRWDLLARCVTGALLVSHGVRADTEVQLALLAEGGPRVVRVRGDQVRRLNPDERSTVALVSKALEATDVGAHESSILPGIHTARRPLEDILAEAAKDGPVVLLREDAGQSLDQWSAPQDAVSFVLSDHRDPTPSERDVLDRHASVHLALGPVSLQADQCIAIVHNRLDKAPSQNRNKP